MIKVGVFSKKKKVFFFLLDEEPDENDKDYYRSMIEVLFTKMGDTYIPNYDDKELKITEEL